MPASRRHLYYKLQKQTRQNRSEEEDRFGKLKLHTGVGGLLLWKLEKGSQNWNKQASPRWMFSKSWREMWERSQQPFVLLLGVLCQAPGTAYGRWLSDTTASAPGSLVPGLHPWKCLALHKGIQIACQLHLISLPNPPNAAQVMLHEALGDISTSIAFCRLFHWPETPVSFLI